MLSIERLGQLLKSSNIAAIEKSTGVSRYNLVRLKRGDKTIPYSVYIAVSDYFSID